MSIIFSVICCFSLIATSFLFMFECGIEFPFGLALGNLCLLRGYIAFTQMIRCGLDSLEDSNMLKILTSIIEYVPSPLMNYEFYKDSVEYRAMAPYHSLSAFPLIFDLMARSYNDSDPDANADALKDFCLWINHISTLYLGIMDDKKLILILPAASLSVRFLPGLMEHFGLIHPESAFTSSATLLMLALKQIMFYMYDAKLMQPEVKSEAAEDNDD